MERKKRWKTRAGGLMFMLAILALYGLVSMLDETLARDALGLTAKLFSRLAPVLLLVFALIFVSNLLIRPEWVRAHVGRHSGARGWGVALLGGILSVGPVYPWYALLGDLREKGMRSALIAVFLSSRAIKLPLLPLMIHYFGTAFTVVLVLYLALFSLLNGLAVERLYSRQVAS